MPRTDMATPSSDAPPRLRPVAWPWWVGAGLLLALFVIYPPVRLVKRGATASAAGGAHGGDVFRCSLGGNVLARPVATGGDPGA
jgi:hypothetical protein